MNIDRHDLHVDRHDRDREPVFHEVIEAAIRDCCDGHVSGDPKGVRYPGVPTVLDVADELNLSDRLFYDCSERWQITIYDYVGACRISWLEDTSTDI